MNRPAGGGKRQLCLPPTQTGDAVSNAVSKHKSTPAVQAVALQPLHNSVIKGSVRNIGLILHTRAEIETGLTKGPTERGCCSAVIPMQADKWACHAVAGSGFAARRLPSSSAGHPPPAAAATFPASTQGRCSTTVQPRRPPCPRQQGGARAPAARGAAAAPLLWDASSRHGAGRTAQSRGPRLRERRQRWVGVGVE